MTGLIIDFEHDSFICDFTVKPVIFLDNGSEPENELGQLLDGASVVVLTADYVHERVGFVGLDVLVWGDGLDLTV
jgi:hypothetical protein